jgi:pyrroloquinoline quinone biosynthesis protein B
LIDAGLGVKTGQRMGHLSMSGEDGTIEMLADCDISQKIFLHVNNSNPALRPHSSERATLEKSGWRVAHDGMEITL